MAFETLKDGAAERAAADAVGLAKVRLEKDERQFKVVIWCSIAFGALLRIAQYLLNRSLWVDEASLALNILHRSYSGLIKPLDYYQGAPFGFLVLEKLAVQSFGPSEYALRLLPLISGVLSLFLFYEVARKSIIPTAVPVATTLFAICASLIYYSSEVKQYSTDVAVALLIYSVVLAEAPASWSTARLVALGCIGAAAIWMSHPAVLVLAGIAVTTVLVLLAGKQRSNLARFSIVVVVWLASLAVSYFVCLRELAHNRTLLDYWKANFMPLPPRSVSDLKWFVDSFFDFFSQTCSLELVGLAALTFITGTAYIYSQSRIKLLFLLVPALLTLLASGLHRYPFGGRLTLFLVPPALLLIAVGAERIMSVTRHRAPVIGYCLMVLLFLDPSQYVLHHFSKPHALTPRPGIMLPEEIKPAMAYVQAQQQPQDVVYLCGEDEAHPHSFADSEPAYQFYEELGRFHESKVVLGTAFGDVAQDYISDLDRLRGQRVWVVCSHIGGAGATQLKYIEFYLSMLGPRIDHFSTAGAAVDLYDLTSGPATSGSQLKH
jgi:hypothetical protein